MSANGAVAGNNFNYLVLFDSCIRLLAHVTQFRMKW